MLNAVFFFFKSAEIYDFILMQKSLIQGYIYVYDLKQFEKILLH